MSKTNTTIDIVGIDDDTIAMRIEMEHQLYLDGHQAVATEAFAALEPFMNNLGKFLTELQKWVRVIKSVDDYEPFDEEDLSLFVNLPDEKDY